MLTFGNYYAFLTEAVSRLLIIINLAKVTDLNIDI